MRLDTTITFSSLHFAFDSNVIEITSKIHQKIIAFFRLHMPVQSIIRSSEKNTFFLLASFYCWNKFSFFINNKNSLIPNPTSFSTEVPIFINSFMYHLTVVLIHRLCKQRSTIDYRYFYLITYYNHISVRLFHL